MVIDPFIFDDSAEEPVSLGAASGVYITTKVDELAILTVTAEMWILDRQSPA